MGWGELSFIILSGLVGFRGGGILGRGSGFGDTVNVDIFACINFRGFVKMGNFACIKIRIFSTEDSLGYNDSNFHSVYIFADI